MALPTDVELMRAASSRSWTENVFSRSSVREVDDEEALKWAALEKLPTYDRLRTAIIKNVGEHGSTRHEHIDVKSLGLTERRNLVEKLLATTDTENEMFIRKLRERIDRVGIDLPKIEVRYEGLQIEAAVRVGKRALPTLFNFVINMSQQILGKLHLLPSKKHVLTILRNVSGIVKPSRMTLLLGPPNAGKTTLLLALSGKLDQSLKVSGRVTYNGHTLTEFVPQRTSAYISQHDLHSGELTVRETFDFASRCQGVGSRYEMITELSRREKNAKIKPDPDVDAFMKASAIEGQETSIVTDYVLKILGLDICSDILVGDAMRRGISGGQKKRVTTGEMLVGPAKSLFMDEISTGLDSSTTFQIVKSLRQFVHVLDATMVISLLQPAPETFELFDDLILLSEGQIVYQGPRELVLDFFETQGFKCPPRKGVADFLQELILLAFITMTVFLRTEMHHRTVGDGSLYMGALFFGLIIIMFNGFAELSMTIARLPVFYKQRDQMLFPAWAFSLPNVITRIPVSLLESALWVCMTYYVVGFASSAARFFQQFLLMFLIHQMSGGLFRFIASLSRTMVVANTFGSFTLLIVLVLGGFLLSREDVEPWWIWGYWSSPMMYAQNALAVNEFSASRWQILENANQTTTVGNQVLESRGLFPNKNWYWLGTGAQLAYAILFNVVFTLALAYFSAPGKPQAVVSEEILEEQNVNRTGEVSERSVRAKSKRSGRSSNAGDLELTSGRMGADSKRGMILPFQPLAMSFNHVNYYVDMPAEMKQQGVTENRLQLLHDVSSSFRPGVLTALVGVSGAGKTTLMDVLAGRKTGGYIEGDIRISGYPKNQATFARISGYCEQTDIHSPNVTVYESLVYSAWLRLSDDIDKGTKKMFVEEVMELVELNPLRDALVGLPGVDGLSTEQRKRLTIAVELVANPSIIFMDEPTSGLDARAAAIVMRTVRNTVDTGRTVVCTIHQPSIDIFEAFDELLLMKRGGRVIYAGSLGKNSHKLVEYFQGISGVPNIREGYNPATWMLEVTAADVENRLGVDFADIYKTSPVYQHNEAIITQLSTPVPGTEDIWFPTQYPLSFLGQVMGCLWKQHQSYWKNPYYVLVRMFFTLVVAIIFGTMFWDIGSKRSREQDLFNLMGSIYAAVLFIGFSNSSGVQPVVAIERTVYYRERAAGMYSPLPYAFAQVLIEIPYVFVQAFAYGLIVYATMQLEWTAAKFLWFLFFLYMTFLYYTLYGMVTVALTPNDQIATIVSTAFYGIWNLFSGFIIPRPAIPVWWRWYYWASPAAWSLYGLLTSQLGDVTTPLFRADGEETTVEGFLRSYFGFRHDFLGVVAGVHVGLVVVFARRCMSSYTSNFSRRLEQLEREGGPDAQEKQVKFLRDLNEVDPEGRPLPQRSASALAEYLKALVKVDRLDDSALLKTLQRGATASLGSFQAEARPIMSSAFPAVGTATKDGILGSPSAPIHMVTSEGRFRVQVWRTVRTLALGFLLLSGVGAIVKDKGLSKGLGLNEEVQPSLESNTKFSDVKRVDEAKAELEEIVHHLWDPKKFTRLGGKLPKGVLLVGPPGTGKRCWLWQLLVKQWYRFSIAAGASSRKCSSELVLGECGTYSQLRRSALNQLLVELDGFKQNEGIIVIAATNFPESHDKALVRPGRFDRHVVVPNPDSYLENIHLYSNRFSGTSSILKEDALAIWTPT
ncbi:ATP-binding cassette transporter [Selaginella moellendorffii]|uniref:ATP-binding cassette transporter n=1 Tax=Selaginella moellendorffii TaxID=88036 RepID=D8RL81_SELML|nr:ATP-binding cassette transporter [Selaginella moellendorffii]